MRGWFLAVLPLLILPAGAQIAALPSSERLQISTPSARRVEPPSPTASADELESRGDELRTQKDYVDALDFYRVALQKSSKSARIHNKAGIAELQIQRYKEGRKDFERAIKLDKEFADAYNNLGVIFYKEARYDKAINRYEKAIQLKPDAASYYSNAGAAYYAQKNWEQATEAYSHAIQLDPDIFERISHSGVTAQLPSPEERARFDYLLAKLYAKAGDRERSLKCLRRALEDGYKDIEDVYKDPEFTALRTDERFTQLMAARPTSVPE